MAGQPYPQAVQNERRSLPAPRRSIAAHGHTIWGLAADIDDGILAICKANHDVGSVVRFGTVEVLDLGGDLQWGRGLPIRSIRLTWRDCPRRPR